MKTKINLNITLNSKKKYKQQKEEIINQIDNHMYRMENVFGSTFQFQRSIWNLFKITGGVTPFEVESPCIRFLFILDSIYNPNYCYDFWQWYEYIALSDLRSIEHEIDEFLTLLEKKEGYNMSFIDFEDLTTDEFKFSILEEHYTCFDGRDEYDPQNATQPMEKTKYGNYKIKEM